MCSADSAEHMATMRAEFHEMVAHHKDRPAKVSYSIMDRKEGYEPCVTGINPLNVEGVRATPLPALHARPPRVLAATAPTRPRLRCHRHPRRHRH